MKAWRLGWARGVVELRQSFSNGGDLVSHFLWPVLMLVALFFLRDREFAGTGILLGTLALPSILGMNAAMGMVSMSQQLTADREDGTLLRAKATPYGVQAYLVGKVVSVAGGLIADLVILFVPAMFLVDGLVFTPLSLLSLLGVLLLGLVATLPIGAILGSAFPSARAQGLVQLPVLAMIAISGIFYRSRRCPAGCRWSRSSRRSTGSGSAPGRLCCQMQPSSSRPASPGGPWRRCWCSVRGLWSAC